MNWRRHASRAYLRIAAPMGRRALARMLGDGLPPRLETPLRFLFEGGAPLRAREQSDAIERVRAEIAARHGPFTLAPTSDPRLLGWSWLANNVSVQRRWGIFLHLCAAGARNVLELGSCVGISGSYLASAASRIVTIEASPELAPVAEETIGRFSNDVQVLRGMFDERLPKALSEPVDVAYIDGHHDGAATQRYVHTIAPHLTPGALIILDDIRLYVEMADAWKTLRAADGVAASIDVGRFGVLVWGRGEGKLYDLARYTGWWPRATRQRPRR